MTVCKRLLEHPDASTLTADVVELMHQAGNPYFDWFFGGPAAARSALERLHEHSSSEIAASRVTVLLDEDRLAGMYVALDGAELARCRAADALALLQGTDSAESRSALASRMAVGHDLFAPVAADELYLSKIGVVPELRGRGYGRTLLEHYLAAGRDAGYAGFRLDVSADNEPAIALYRSAGFRIESQRETDGLRYVMMALEQPATASPNEPASLGGNKSLQPRHER